jgi:hypothetical protein
MLILLTHVTRPSYIFIIVFKHRINEVKARQNKIRAPPPLGEEIPMKKSDRPCMNEVLSGPTGEIAIARNGWNAVSLVDL